MRTNGDTLTTADASVGSHQDRGLQRDSFGIVAPGAGQGAALQEDGRTNAWSIVNRETLDIEDLSELHDSAPPGLDEVRLREVVPKNEWLLDIE